VKFADFTTRTQTQFFTKVSNILLAFEEIVDYLEAVHYKGEEGDAIKREAIPYETDG